MRITVIPEDDAMTPVQFTFSAKHRAKPVEIVVAA